MRLSASSHVAYGGDLRRDSIFHPAAGIMPAVFPVAKGEKACGQDLVTSIAGGYKVSIRVAKNGDIAPLTLAQHLEYTKGRDSTFGERQRIDVSSDTGSRRSIIARILRADFSTMLAGRDPDKSSPAIGLSVT